jgi:hypothetical protein
MPTTNSEVPNPSLTSVESADSLTIIEIAHETGTHAVIKSPHLDLLTPLVSRRGRIRIVHHRSVEIKLIRKKQIKKINKNHNQYQY